MNRRIDDPSALRDLAPFAAVLAAVIAVLLATTFLYVRMSDGLRGYVHGESIWTKAQKEAVFELDEYAATGDSADLRAYREALSVPLAARRAREALLANELDREAARRALRESGNHPADFPEMIMVVRWFGGLSAVEEPLRTWMEADSAVVELQRRAERIQEVLDEHGPDSPESTAAADALRGLDQRFTALERRFSRQMGELDRRLSRTFLIVLSALGSLLFVLALGAAWALLARVRSSRATLRDREERLRLVTRATNDVIWDFDPETGETRWSDALETTLGYDPERIDGDRAWWRERVHPDDRDRVTGLLESALASLRETFAAEYRFRRADGSWAVIYDRGYVVRDEDGEPVRMIGSFLDLTENREIERALHRSRTRYRELLEQASDAILILRDDLTIEMVNGEACRILGYDREELVGRNARELIAEESLREKPLRMDAVRRGETVVRERTMVRKDGTGIPMEFSTRQLQDGRVQTIGRDVRERRELEARVRRSEKMEAVGRLAGGVAHDFNNLLTAIRGHTQLALAELPDDHPVRDDVDAADRSAERAAELVSKLLAFSRRRPSDPGVVDVNEELRSLRGTLDGLATERVELELDLEPDVGRVPLDPVQLEQVVLNLVFNARDAILDGGRIHVKTGRVDTDGDQGRPGPGRLEPGRYVSIRVRDDGVGMDAETLERIFEPFYTEKEEGRGTGLGLASVYGIVDEAGGTIQVESRPGEGSTFEVFLPAVDEAPPAEGRAAGA